MTQLSRISCLCNSYWLFVLFLSIPVLQLAAQTGPEKYWVEFTDKDNNGFSVQQPSAFLSAKAINRRTRQQIAITEQDLPVTKAYTDSLEKLGIKVLYTSKWFNAATIKSTDTALLDTLHYLNFVKNRVYSYRIPAKQLNVPKKATPKKTKKSTPTVTANFEYYDHQLKMLNGHLLHDQGFQGQGMLIAVIDGGFLSVDKLPAFENLRNEDRLLATKNFVDDTTSLFRTGSHGMKVLSLMAGDIPDELIGTAPLAEYVLIQSEDGSSEYKVEADNWIAAVEYADSIGVDVINSSLGYHDFDDDLQDLSYNDLNGKTARNSLAADIAFSKGMLVVTSAGNQGNKNWKYITTPADAFNVLTIGAVDPSGEVASFSSVGPTSDGRLKPNVSALGYGAFVQQLNGTVYYGSGTSYSSPIMAGMSACLWQAFPDAGNGEIKAAIEKSASQYTSPDSVMGYGIPDFLKAQLLLSKTDMPISNEKELLHIIPNPFSDFVYIELSNSKDSSTAKLKIVSTSGKKVFQDKIQLVPGENIITIDELSVVPSGSYVLQLKTKNTTHRVTILKK